MGDTVTVPSPPAGKPPLVTVQIAGRTLAIVAAAIVLTWLALRMNHFLLIVVFAVLLATAIDEPVSWLERHGVPRPLGILLHYVVLVLLAAVVVFVLIPLVTAEAKLLKQELPGYMDRLETLIDRYTPGASPHFSLDDVAKALQGHLGSLAERAEKVTVEAASVVMYSFITLVLAFFLATEPGIPGKLAARFAPNHQDRVQRVAAESRDRIGEWARGQVLIALIFGLLMGIGLKLIGVPYAVSLGVAAGVLELLPYVGGFVTVILAGLTALSVGMPQLIGVIVLYLVLVNVESHILSPLLFGKAIGLPPVAILISLLAGVELLGIAGALLAIPAMVILWVLVEEIWPAPAPAGAPAAAPVLAAPPGVD